jgi:hypothetical protein
LKAKEPRDRSASVRARLLNLARDRGEDFQITLRNYLFERFLYRLSRSELRERFVLKGAMLLRLWADQPYRAAVDLDLLSRGNPRPRRQRGTDWRIGRPLGYVGGVGKGKRSSLRLGEQRPARDLRFRP